MVTVKGAIRRTTESLGDRQWSHGCATMQVSDTGTVEVVERITLDTGGGGDLVVTTRYTGRKADAMRLTSLRRALRTLPRPTVSTMPTSMARAPPWRSCICKDDPGANVLTTKEHYYIQQAWDTLEDRNVLVFNTLGYTVRDHQVKPGTLPARRPCGWVNPTGAAPDRTEAACRLERAAHHLRT
ncbi:MAG: hypothetical protein IPN38_19020 [Flavobacteriales bacterium]|nr:hypothetical protein [Flavobacteriales bacterium]